MRPVLPAVVLLSCLAAVEAPAQQGNAAPDSSVLAALVVGRDTIPLNDTSTDSLIRRALPTPYRFADTANDGASVACWRVAELPTPEYLLIETESENFGTNTAYLTIDAARIPAPARCAPLTATVRLLYGKLIVSLETPVTAIVSALGQRTVVAGAKQCWTALWTGPPLKPNEIGARATEFDGQAALCVVAMGLRVHTVSVFRVETN
jgi:hypothetical protein